MREPIAPGNIALLPGSRQQGRTALAGSTWSVVVCMDLVERIQVNIIQHPTLAGRVQHSTCLGVLRHIQMVRNYNRQK